MGWGWDGGGGGGGGGFGGGGGICFSENTVTSYKYLSNKVIIGAVSCEMGFMSDHFLCFTES